ncbi:hypothetical protein HK101_009111 [Irineochytrium annulatum]|nr:hypothetical protein HK101_009111 [Irineochytrium annulatum]
MAADIPLTIGVGFPFSYVGDDGWSQSCLDVMNVRLATLKQNASLHPAVRDMKLTVLDLHTWSSSDGIRGGLSFYTSGVQAVVGAGYSQLTIGLSSALAAFNVPLCDGSSTSPVLSDKHQYPNFFRTVVQDDLQAAAMVDLIVDQGWTEVAILASQDNYGQGIADNAQVLARAANVTISTRQNFYVGLADYRNEIENLKASGTRIILFAGQAMDFVTFANQSQPAKIFGKGYQWITTDAVMQNMDMYAVMGGLMEGVMNVFPSEGVNPLYSQFAELFAAQNASIYPSVPGGLQPYGMFFINCIEAYVYGFDRLLKAKPSLVPAPGKTWNLSAALDIPWTFSFPDMDSVTGRVIYDANGDRIGSYGYTTYNLSAGTFTTFGFHDVNGVHYTDTFLYQGGALAKPATNSAALAISTIIGGSDPVALVIYILSGVSVVACLATGVSTYICRNEKLIKSSSVEFLMLILVGLIMGSVYPLILTGPPTKAKCIAELWVLPAAFSMIMANLVSKSFRVHRIFNTSAFTAKSVSNAEVISLVWTLVAPPEVTWKVIKFQNDFYENQSECVSGNTSSQLLILVVVFCWNALLLLGGVYLAFANRNLPAMYSEASSMSTVIYNFCVVDVLLVPFGFLFTTPKSTQVLIKALGTFVCVWVALIMLFVAKLFKILWKEVKIEAKDAQRSLIHHTKETDESGEKKHDPDQESIRQLRWMSEKADLCYVLDPTRPRRSAQWQSNLLYVSAAHDFSLVLTPKLISISVFLLPLRNWLPAVADAEALGLRLAAGEQFFAIVLTRKKKSQVKGHVNEVIIRFKEAEQLEGWAAYLTNESWKIKEKDSVSYKKLPIKSGSFNTELDNVVHVAHMTV